MPLSSFNKARTNTIYDTAPKKNKENRCRKVEKIEWSQNDDLRSFKTLSLGVKVN